MGRLLFLLLGSASISNIAYGSSGMTQKEMCKSFVESQPKIPLENVGEYDMIFNIERAGWDWMYSRYGHTVIDHGIKEKRPFWYVLRGLLTTFDQEKQERFTALSGIFVSDSLTLGSCEDADLIVQDALRLESLHYHLACGWRPKEATMAKHAWYALARANPTITSSFWRERTVDGKLVCEQMCAPTFAQMLENLEKPGKDGLHYLTPDVDSDYFFFSDDPVIMERQLKGLQSRSQSSRMKIR